MDTFFDERKTKPHIGYNLRRIREIIGMKQDVLGMSIKNPIKQQTVSKWENAETIPDDLLEEFADALGVTPEFIKNFNEEKAIYNIQNNRDHSTNHQNYQPNITYEPVEKVVEVFEKFIANDKERSDLIVNLNKAVISLAEEVKKLKAEK
ncbi:helix-turn-helix domain-containing protein [Albibacterium indicum]|uniref:helix-turn-helix domain-containing protein n=1 Tax=Albibacterium indicum TaxID=2292082 RepID=UPI000E4BAB20|nr:helix-turn-helix transcriptional regulator [Pedobacter indicus]